MNDIVTIYFSKDRPLQLDLALTTNREHTLNLQNEWVIYKASNKEYENAYIELSKQHDSIHFIKETNFKKDLLTVLQNNVFVLFVVDDTIFTSNYDIKELCQLMKNIPQLLGVSLRLGKNTIHSYPTNTKNDIPEMKKAYASKPIYVFNWKTATGDFGYPLELSSSVYSIQTILKILEVFDYNNPNELEWIMYCNLPYVAMFSLLACYETSVAFSNPINKVQTTNNNRSGDKFIYTPEQLLKIFQQGGRIKSQPLNGFVSNGCHQEVELEFSYSNHLRI